jgi:mevalonate kinase
MAAAAKKAYVNGAATKIPNGHSKKPSLSSSSDGKASTDSLASDFSGSTLGQTNGVKNGGLSPRPGVQRRPSAPMMPAFMVSAPGKVIVYGEHAVVHGKV